MTLTMADLDRDPVRFTLRSLNIDANELESFASCLQGELKKIEGFRNELPMTTAVLNDLICDVRERMAEGSGKVVLKQLFPAKSERLEDLEAEADGRREWMDAAVLWSGSTQKAKEAARIPSIGREGENGRSKSGPFDVDRMARSVPGSIPTPLPFPSLEVPVIAPVVVGSNCGEANRSLGLCSSRTLFGGVALEFPSSRVEQQQQQQVTRKARRCWSRELHRKFESALEQLGGPDVATPKQIREVMKVEGLTNDEVKSHLQKYRIHSKKMSPAVKLDLHLKTSPVHSPNSPLELSHFGASWIGHRPGSCGYESTIDRCNGEVSG